MQGLPVQNNVQDKAEFVSQVCRKPNVYSYEFGILALNEQLKSNHIFRILNNLNAKAPIYDLFLK
jgi:hypothetical protein